MLAMPDKAIAAAIQAAFNQFRQSAATLAPEIYAQETTANQSAIETWWTTASNVVTVGVGYPLQQVKPPIVAVTIEAEQEMDRARFIGSQSGLVVPGAAGTGSYGYATQLRGRYSIACLGVNQDWVLWMEVLTRWALLSQRRNLQQPPPAGALLYRQTLSAAGFAPVPNSMADSVYHFARVLVLEADRLDTWSGSVADTVAGASVSVEVGAGS